MWMLPGRVQRLNMNLIKKFFDEKGITYYQPTDEELNQWKEYAASLSDKWRELIGEELYNQVSELFNY